MPEAVWRRQINHDWDARAGCRGRRCVDHVQATSGRRAARESVAAYHEEHVGEPVRRVKVATERFQAGEIGAFEVDGVILQYSRAPKELSRLCNLVC